MSLKFNKLFDWDEITNQLNNLHLNDNLVSEDDEHVNSDEFIDRKSVFDMYVFETDMDSEDLILHQELLNQFGPSFFEQVIFDP